MKIATTTGDFEKFCNNDIERIEKIYEAGFRYIDLNMYSFTPDCVYMSGEWENATEKILARAESLGMEFVQAHSQGGNPLHPDTSCGDFIVDATNRSIEICSKLGIKNTVVHPGYRAGYSKEEWFEANRQFYQRLIPYMEKYNVNVLIENSTKANMGSIYFANSGKDMKEFIQYVDHPLLHGCWDTGHANCEGNQYDDILELGEEIYAIHYNDNHGHQDEHLIPYMGTLNHDEVMNALIKIGYKGYFTLECSSSLISANYWLGGRRKFLEETRLSEPGLFIQEELEKTMYKTAKYILTAYEMFTE